MASKTISLKTQNLNSFGPSPSTKWQKFNWTLAGVGPGNGTWGMKSAACQGTASIQKGLFRTLSHSSMSVGISLPATSVFRSLNKVHVHTIVASYSNSDKELTDGRGFHYVYPGPVTNAELENNAVYVSQSVAAIAYTSNAVTTTSWS